jgi:hypothetical protein
VVALPSALLSVATPLYALALGAYGVRAAARWVRGTPNPGKDLVVATTAVAWYVGVVAFDSDYAFTVTNVFMHGIPYVALVFAHTRARRDQTAPEGDARRRPLDVNLALFLGALWLVAFLEEALWDRTVWHERGWLFGEGWSIGGLKVLVVPLLALPQLTHYVLDGFIWRRRSNPSVANLVAGSSASGL